MLHVRVCARVPCRKNGEARFSSWTPLARLPSSTAHVPLHGQTCLESCGTSSSTQQWAILNNFLPIIVLLNAYGTLHLSVYYYISNYLLLVALSCVVFLIRRPLGLAGAALALLALLCLNDPFAAAVK